MKRGFLNSSKAKKEPLYRAPSNQQLPRTGPYVPPPFGRTTLAPVTKLAYGKVENKVVPEDYRPADITIMRTHPMKTGHPADQLLSTTIPWVANEANNSDGQTEWLVHSATKAKVVNAPGFPLPVPKAIGPPAYVVKPTSNRGMDVFTTRDIKLGELFFAERPLLAPPQST